MPKDDFEDEHNASEKGQGGGPPERQHRYTTADMKPERPWKRWCCTCICCLLVIAIMIIISIYMQKLFDPPEDEDWSDDEAMHDDDNLQGVNGELSGAASPLPKNMEYIEDVCSEEKIGRNDKSMCEAACEPAADCCDPFKNGGNSTCLEEELAGCFTYAKCHSLNGFLDPAHNDLDRICSRASLEINREECELACQGLDCCFKEEESCISHNFGACMDYAACQNLKEDSIDVAPMDLDERCSKQSPTCKRDCREALCCSDPNSKCYRENFVACLSYSACTGNSDTKITVAPIYSRVPKAPATLTEACSAKGIGEFGVDKCLGECAIAQCCWDTGAGGCFGDDPLGCMEYQRCSILKQQPDYATLTYPPINGAATGNAAGATTAPAAGSNSNNNSTSGGFGGPNGGGVTPPAGAEEETPAPQGGGGVTPPGGAAEETTAPSGGAANATAASNAGGSAARPNGGATGGGGATPPGGAEEETPAPQGGGGVTPPGGAEETPAPQGGGGATPPSG